jgi:hypothetical protein
MQTELLDERQQKGLFLSVILFLTATILLLTTAIFGIVYALFYLPFTKGQKLSQYFIDVALVLDQSGNVIMQHALNAILLKNAAEGYRFGNKKETISSVIGKNQLLHNLSVTGKCLNSILDFLDPHHAMDSIQHDVKKRGKQMPPSK